MNEMSQRAKSGTLAQPKDRMRIILETVQNYVEQWRVRITVASRADYNLSLFIQPHLALHDIWPEPSDQPIILTRECIETKLTQLIAIEKELLALLGEGSDGLSNKDTTRTTSEKSGNMMTTKAATHTSRASRQTSAVMTQVIQTASRSSDAVPSTQACTASTAKANNQSFHATPHNPEDGQNEKRTEALSGTPNGSPFTKRLLKNKKSKICRRKSLGPMSLEEMTNSTLYAQQIGGRIHSSSRGRARSEMTPVRTPASPHYQDISRTSSASRETRSDQRESPRKAKERDGGLERKKSRSYTAADIEKILLDSDSTTLKDVHKTLRSRRNFGMEEKTESSQKMKMLSREIKVLVSESPSPRTPRKQEQAWRANLQSNLNQVSAARNDDAQTGGSGVQLAVQNPETSSAEDKRARKKQKTSASFTESDLNSTKISTAHDRIAQDKQGQPKREKLTADGQPGSEVREAQAEVERLCRENEELRRMVTGLQFRLKTAQTLHSVLGSLLEESA